MLANVPEFLTVLEELSPKSPFTTPSTSFALVFLGETQWQRQPSVSED